MQVLKAYVLRHLPRGASSAVSDKNPARAARCIMDILTQMQLPNVSYGGIDDASSTTVMCN